MTFEKTEQHPTASGTALTEDQLEQVSQTVYARFYWEYGIPVWPDLSASNKQKIRNRVKEVLDGLVACRFEITLKQGEQDVGRELLTRHILKTTPRNR